MHTDMISKHHRFIASFKRAFSPALIQRLMVGAAVAMCTLSVSAAENTPLSASPLSLPAEQQFQEELDRWMLQAYEGDRDAQFKVGVLFTNNQFKKADFEQAVYWYKQAARQGHALSQYNLGHQYLTGSGVKRSEGEAMKWWLKAANQDHPLAQFNVGRGYYLGIGLNEDHSQSEYWFKRAAKNNEPKSIEILNQLGWAAPGEFVSKENVAADDAITTNISPAVIDVAAKPLAPINNADTVTDDIESSADDNTPPPAVSNTDESNQNTQIAVYTNPNKRAVLISILDSSDGLEIIKQSEKWARVRNADGLPVWVHEDFITVKGTKGTIIGNNVNARSVPLIRTGTIVGRLSQDAPVEVLARQKQWYRVQSPASFIAWVKNDDLTENMRTPSKPVQNTPLAAPKDDSATIAAVTPTTLKSKTTYSNENEWLFSQSPTDFTLQLASFDDPVKIAEFESREKFANNANLRRFTATSKNIEWTYYLYGSYEDSDSAKQGREKIGQKRAWVRTFGRLQQNRCLAWKKKIPTPKALNKYCS